MKLIFPFLLLVPIIASSQDTSLNKIFPVKYGHIVFEKVITDSSFKEVLFKRANFWIENNKAQMNAEITSDEGIGEITGNISFSDIITLPGYTKGPSSKTQWLYWYTIKIFVKDSTAKIIISNIRFSGLANTNLIDIETYREQVEQSMSSFDKRYKKDFWNAVYTSFENVSAHIKNDIGRLEYTLKHPITTF